MYILKGFLPIWLKGIYNGCYSTTSNVTDAISPAFVIPGTYIKYITLLIMQKMDYHNFLYSRK